MSGRLPPSLPTCSTAASWRVLPIANGPQTSPTCGRRKAGSTSLQCSIVRPARRRLVDERRDDGPTRPAIWRRGKPDALLHHSDRRSQYNSERFQRLLANRGVVCSMSRSGKVWDNAAMERFFSSLKTERTARKTYRTREDAKAGAFDYI
jgi:hypothetical protein